jgi:two-component system, NtrC family, C4-dicarboxylate transport sensor histidine kinase DctB
MKADASTVPTRRMWFHAPARNIDRKLLRWGGVFALFLMVTYTAYNWNLRSGIDSLREADMQRLKVYISSLEGVLGKYDYLPKTLELNKDVFKLLRSPDNPELVATVNEYLEQVNEQAKSSAIYILDLKGIALAASNWNKPYSFVGVDLAFRPYVQDVLHNTPGRFYGIGTTSNEAGYYFAHGIYRGGELVGVATVKVGLEKLEKTWMHGADKVIVADENNVIFLGSVPTLKYKTLGRLPQETLSRLDYTRQYYRQKLDPVEFTDDEVFADGSRIVSVHSADGPDRLENMAMSGLLTQGRTTLQPDWRFMLLSDLTRVKRNARTAGAFAAAIFGFLLFMILYRRQRQLAVAQSLVAKEALQRAYDNLELMVAERTSELNATMRNLTQEIAERRQAQLELQTTQNELIQAGKMAVLGQMSAGITHELNQPLTALRTMSDNALVLLERGCSEEVGRNLMIIAQTVDRMAVIMRQLKVFARKSTSELTAVSVQAAIVNALFLVDRGLRLQEVVVTQNIPQDEVYVLGDCIRLEQVLVNLFNNALDSMVNSRRQRLDIDVRRERGRVLISVGDSGAGISEEAARHLFEPFFTTKEQGVGLGLGLVISAQIVREFGGVLSGRNGETTGAVFTVELQAAGSEVKHA